MDFKPFRIIPAASHTAALMQRLIEGERPAYEVSLYAGLTLSHDRAFASIPIHYQAF